ncbi:pimeloyl-ACP methyl esterase BioG family protein [Paracoccus aestuariivivens]|uniref:DUF452 family protein n=1 Tax=Paracoccus aestuariivivens TaxID=1820333 RepID=A0A6L6J8I3_9RHOB|nr:pimeloyl-ACP methyl esterase BioG family protein [Paracoccus aestuariivivens]MTH78463.1 DUF452 family protein [Paracoccus aestuariivivens]
MRQTWLRRQGSSDLVLIYSGWAVGAMPFLHLAGASDVLVLDDYRDENLPAPLLVPYARIRVLAYSLGVAVAARQLAALQPDFAVAVCGSPFVANDRLGIPSEIFARTMTELTPANLARFARRAGAALPPDPDLAALGQELGMLAQRPAAENPRFDHVIASRNDRIFPASALQSAWAGHRIRWLETGHNPFPIWQDWQEIFA